MKGSPTVQSARISSISVRGRFKIHADLATRILKQFWPPQIALRFVYVASIYVFALRFVLILHAQILKKFRQDEPFNGVFMFALRFVFALSSMGFLCF